MRASTLNVSTAAGLIGLAAACSAGMEIAKAPSGQLACFWQNVDAHDAGNLSPQVLPSPQSAAPSAANAPTSWGWH